MKKRLRWIVPAAAAALLLCVFFAYAGSCYPADAAAEAAMASDEAVRVLPTEYGWLFDGASESYALILYPGGKVDAAAYAPLCRALALAGVDVCLTEMPLRLAFFGTNKADGIIGSLEYEHWFIAGHSLGGVFAASYAAEHGDKLDGLILLASYPAGALDDTLPVLRIYGSEDGVLNMEKYRKSLAYVPEHSVEYVIEGGNHAQFGSYGAQKGDGTALISQERQVEETAAAIVRFILEAER